MKFDDHVEKADQIIERADALLNRHQDQAPSFAASLPPGSATTTIPVLTEVIDDSNNDNAEAAPPPTSRPATPPPPAAASTATAEALIEHLIGIEAEVTRAVEHWLQQELPEIIERETRALAERVQTQINAHARATLATALSERIGAHLLAAEKRQQAAKP